MPTFDLENIALGKPVNYARTHDPNLLFAIPRAHNRSEISLAQALPFTGIDHWTAYELSWLDEKGKPQIAIADFLFPCESVNLIESKSFKLYLNSFAQTAISDVETLIATLTTELSAVAQADVAVNLTLPVNFTKQTLTEFSGTCLDALVIETNTYTVQTDFLTTENTRADETLYSNLFGSVCPITRQPDWGSVLIHYRGVKIHHAGLLKYIISYREHGEFHEQCIERIFTDILRHCRPEALTVYGRYTRRGGLDINPFRSNFEQPYLLRNYRQ